MMSVSAKAAAGALVLFGLLSISCATRETAGVKLVQSGNGAKLLRNGKPYLIKGGGGGGSPELLVKMGGNSIRTWGADNLQPILDKAQSLGLSVTIGIWLGHLEHGFRYDDPKQVQEQFDKATQAIETYKNHPALLMWAIGNEEEASGDDPKIWKAVEDIAKAAKQIDQNHPTMTVIAEVGGKKVENLHRYCPDIDIVGINSYGGAPSIPGRYVQAGGKKPYILTEFGPPGVWESAKTPWGAGYEPNSTAKAEFYRKAYVANVVENPKLCLGSYAFTWGWKQEATATWFGMLLPDGSRLACVDALSELWTRKAPDNLAPKIENIVIEGDPEVRPGSTIKASVKTSSPASRPLKIEWVLQRDGGKYGQNGDAEPTPAILKEAVHQTDDKVEVSLPSEEATYRLFAYVHDDRGGAATANVPLHAANPDMAEAGREATLPLIVYGPGSTQPYVPSGWMGDTGALKMNLNSKTEPHTGSRCLQFDFTQGSGWAGVAWQSPQGDWGDKPGGWDLRSAKRLTFWARGATGHETVGFGVGLIGSGKKFKDSAIEKLDAVQLGTTWKKYTIDLTGKKLYRIKTGFVVSFAAKGTPLQFYLSEIQFE